MTKAHQHITSALLFALLGLTLWIYWPGLNGPLLLDDIPNLHPLATIGPVDDTSSFLYFVLQNSHSYPVRPLSLASFLINDVGWPLYVWMHKYTNLLLHLLNGVLVFWLALLLCRSARAPSNINSYIALTTAALWLLAPLQVSTVLYVIQRMTELSALFVLCGLITYCYGRQRLNRKPVYALLQMTFGVIVFGLLGFLCKENAVLLLLYILVIEHTVFRSSAPVAVVRTRFWFSIWQWLVLAAPVMATFAVVLSRGVLEAYKYRPFTAFERVASQPRVLFDYLQNLLAPVRHGMGLTHDDFTLSTGLLSPPTTILAILALFGLVIAAIYMSRKTASLFGLAVLWFASGHLLESSVLALEPYWEHRNYLPAFGPFFAVSFAVWTKRHNLSRFLRTAFMLYIGLLAVLTHQNVAIWSDHLEIAEVWAAEHPDSVRAQQLRADFWSRRGYVDEADKIVRRIAERQPGSMGVQVQVLLTTCRNRPDRLTKTLSDVMPRIGSAHFDHAVIPNLQILMNIREAACPQLTQLDLLDLIDALLQNDSVNRLSNQVTTLLAMKASVLSRIASPQAVVSHLYAAFQRQPKYSIGILAVEYLYEIGQYEVALQVLNETQKIEYKPWSPERLRHKQLQDWEQRIMSELEREGS